MKAVSVALTAGMIGCIFLQPAFAAAGGKARETVLHSFGSGTDGHFPDAGLIDLQGTLYGTTSAGGANSDGTVFSLNPKTGKEKVVYSFCSVCGDGENPEGGLIAVNGKLYGTTAYGGNAGCQFGCGTVFSLDPNTGAEKTLYAFHDSNDGQYPWAGLISVNGTLYGTTLAGGTSGNGTVFAVDPNTGAETVLHSFGRGADSQEPEGSLVAVNRILYGVTLFGGAHGFGTVFSLDLGSGAARVLHSFCGKKCLDGAYPYAGLITVKGALYGTTSQGGDRACFGMGCGTVFAVDPATGAEKVLYPFKDNGSDGQEPVGNLIDIGGTLYGTSSQGGDTREGTVFALTKR
jgi:uncharacterized repeat protein (TIGR03803 family)